MKYKKQFVLILIISFLFIAGCTTLPIIKLDTKNIYRNTISEILSKYDSSDYIIGVGEASLKEAQPKITAEQRAKAEVISQIKLKLKETIITNLKQIDKKIHSRIEINTESITENSDLPFMKIVYSQADKQTKTHYAMCVLSRKESSEILLKNIKHTLNLATQYLETFKKQINLDNIILSIRSLSEAYQLLNNSQEYLNQYYVISQTINSREEIDLFLQDITMMKVEVEQHITEIWDKITIEKVKRNNLQINNLQYTQEQRIEPLVIKVTYKNGKKTEILPLTNIPVYFETFFSGKLQKNKIYTDVHGECLYLIDNQNEIKQDCLQVNVSLNPADFGFDFLNSKTATFTVFIQKQTNKPVKLLLNNGVQKVSPALYEKSFLSNSISINLFQEQEHARVKVPEYDFFTEEQHKGINLQYNLEKSGYYTSVLMNYFNRTGKFINYGDNTTLTFILGKTINIQTKLFTLSFIPKLGTNTFSDILEINYYGIKIGRKIFAQGYNTGFNIKLHRKKNIEPTFWFNTDYSQSKFNSDTEIKQINELNMKLNYPVDKITIYTLLTIRNIESSLTGIEQAFWFDKMGNNGGIGFNYSGNKFNWDVLYGRNFKNYYWNNLYINRYYELTGNKISLKLGIRSLQINYSQTNNEMKIQEQIITAKTLEDKSSIISVGYTLKF